MEADTVPIIDKPRSACAPVLQPGQKVNVWGRPEIIHSVVGFDWITIRMTYGPSMPIQLFRGNVDLLIFD